MIKNTTYEISKKNNKKICLLSDIHLARRYDYNLLLKVYDNIKENKPDYICISGDLIDDASLLNDKVIYNRLTKFLSYLATIAPVLFVSGNHDVGIYNLPSYKKFNNCYKDVKLKNVYYLNNKNIEFKDINFVGLNESFEFYKKREKEKYLELNNIDKLIKKDKYNILLFHSPYCIKNVFFKQFDLILCGHMHNGLVPSKLDKIFKNRCLITPYFLPFSSRERKQIKLSEKTNVIISGGIIKISPVNRIDYFNKFFDSHIEYVYI